MDTRAELLKNYINEKYGSINSFCMQSGIAPSTMASIFRRGIGGASGDLLLKICKELGISADKLLGEGKIEKRVMDIHEVSHFDLELLTAYYEKVDLQEAVNILLGVTPKPHNFPTEQ